jgi:hypothetical protein
VTFVGKFFGWMSALLLFSITACEWPPARGRVVIVGDSISWMAGYMGGDYNGAANYSVWGGRAPDGLPLIEADVQDPARSPHVVVIAYGHNYYASGLTAEDLAVLDALVAAPADGACLVMLLPAYFGPDAHRVDVINRYRQWATGVMDDHPGQVITVDWAEHVAAHPEYVEQGDGLHLTQAGAVPFADSVRSGIGWCLAYT